MAYHQAIESRGAAMEGAMSTKRTKGDKIRERLIAARELLGLTQAEMADQLLTPLSTYEQWEAGRYRVPGVAALAAELLCSAEGLSLKGTKRKPH
jgi:DNA-binding transcriptional regulator YiaG